MCDDDQDAYAKDMMFDRHREFDAEYFGELKDRSGAECGVCGYPLALITEHDCDETIANRKRFYDGKTPIYPDWTFNAPGSYTLDSVTTYRNGRYYPHDRTH